MVLSTLMTIFLEISKFRCQERKTIEIGQRRARNSRQIDIDASCISGNDIENFLGLINRNLGCLKVVQWMCLNRLE